MFHGVVAKKEAEKMHSARYLTVAENLKNQPFSERKWWGVGGGSFHFLSRVFFAVLLCIYAFNNCIFAFQMRSDKLKKFFLFYGDASSMSALHVCVSTYHIIRTLCSNQTCIIYNIHKQLEQLLFNFQVNLIPMFSVHPCIHELSSLCG